MLPLRQSRSSRHPETQQVLHAENSRQDPPTGLQHQSKRDYKFSYSQNKADLAFERSQASLWSVHKPSEGQKPGEAHLCRRWTWLLPDLGPSAGEE